MVTLLFTMFLIRWLMVIKGVNTNEFTVFVSRNGTDSDECGNCTNPCGTLFGATTYNKTLESLIINVMDGQNEAEILLWNTINNLTYDPCLPSPFNSIKSVTITFNSTTITQLNQWFPQPICDFGNKNKTYLNAYMFNGRHKLIINNLIVDNYQLEYRYGLLKSTDWFNTSIQCNNCIFINITSSNTYPLIHTQSRIYLFNNQVINIYTNG
eukprot:454312_1